MNRVSLGALACALSLSIGCTAGPGNKPSSLGWKVSTEATPLSFPPTRWTSGELSFELSAARYERRYTVFEDQSYTLRFQFEVRNVGSTPLDLNKAERPQASLILADGRPAPPLVFLFIRKGNALLLEPGQTAKGVLFTESSVPKDARPKLLTIAGQRVEW